MMSFLIGCVVSVAVPAPANAENEAAKAFTAGNALLAKADFDGALEAFRTAARTDTENQEYAQRYAMLRQVIRMRKNSATERNAEQWLKTAAALRTFYHDHRLYSEALPLDKECHRRRQSAESAVHLAETQLALGVHSEAAQMLAGLTQEQTSPRTRVLHGLALARLGQIDEAKKTAKAPGRIKDDVGPRYFYDLARIHALAGEAKKTSKTLTRSFELTPPSRLDAFRAEVKECKDFGSVLGATDFASVLETRSRVKESKCSKGAGCGKCPKRAQCAHKHAKPEKKKP
jgi:tetratricopeptide (TPR) repeat protein